MRNLSLINILLLLFSLITLLPGAEAAAVPLPDGLVYEDLGDDVTYFETNDEAASLTRALTHSGEWKIPDKSPPNFGFSKSAYWFKAELNNELDKQRHFLLSVNYPLLDQLEIYVLENQTSRQGFTNIGNVKNHFSLGDSLPFNARKIENRNFIVPLAMGPRTTTQLYIYLRTNSSVQLPIALWKKDLYHKQDSQFSLGMGLYYGVLIVMAIYNLFLYFTVREKSYLYYVIYVSAFCLHGASLSGDAYQYLWPELPWWNDISPRAMLFATNLGAILFAIQFLSLKQNAPRLYKISIGLAGFSGFMLLAVFFASYSLTIRIGVILSVINTFAVLFISTYLLRKGLKHARFYVMGWSVFLSGCVLLALTAMGLLPLIFFTEHSAKLGSIIEVVLLSFALADRINMERKEKLLAQTKLQEAQVALYEERFEKTAKSVAAEAAMQAKDQFLSTMSHEIRTPMNGVVGILQLFQDTPLDTQQKELLRIMNGSAQTLLSIINDILDFSKIQAGKMQIEHIVFDLHLFLDDIASLYSMTTKLNGEVNFIKDIQHGVPKFVVGDPVRLKQILTNFLNNAVKFTAKGDITLAATPEENGFIRFSIKDSGIGISAEGLAKLFQPYSQTEADTSRKYGGTGLGLSICKKLSELMGGDVGVNSVVNEGSTFWCRVSLPECAPPVNACERGGKENVQFCHLRVLVAEDNRVNQFVVKNMLKKLGVTQVDFAENGEEAINKHAENPYDLILMDCQMPVLDGLEATRAIRQRESIENLPRAPIAALTASASQEEQKTCHESGMDLHIAKPLLLPDLEAALERLISMKTPV